MTYRLYYVSADGPGPNTTWSVYSELYVNEAADQPIDGTQLLVDTLDTEGDAQEYAAALQRAEKERS